MSGAAHSRPSVTISGRKLVPTEVFDTYWRFAARRQAVYLARLGGPQVVDPDPIISEFRFTNVFRASDRVSQYLISKVQRGPTASDELVDQVFRTLLFKIFNREDTWKGLESAVGQVTWRTFKYDRYVEALDSMAASGPIYSAAYVMPPPKLGEDRKHRNHLRLLQMMMQDGIVGKIRSSSGLRGVFEALLSYPGIGPFLAFQYAIDLNYLDVMPFDENDYVVAGPGAKDGIRKCFGALSHGIEADIIRYVVDTQVEHINRLGLSFGGLFGRQLHLIDAQNLFCEVDKYSRVAHPEIAGISGRSRIKQRFQPGETIGLPAFPDRWRLAHQVVEWASASERVGDVPVPETGVGPGQQGILTAV